MMTKGANIGLEQVVGERSDLVVVIETISEGESVAPDASVLLVDEHRRVRSNDDLIFYNQPAGAGGAVRLVRLGDDEVVDDRVRRDAVEVELQLLPMTVQRIVIAASTDIDTSPTFGRAASVRMWVATSDSPLEPQASFEITDLGEESALIFGEIYRRGDAWKLRAVGQGYDAGLAALVTEFGIDVDESVESAIDLDDGAEFRRHSEDVAQTLPVEDGASEAGGREPEGEDLAESTRKLAINRRRRPARIASDWQQRRTPYLPVVEEVPWQRARLFTTVGIKNSMEPELRATGSLLSVVEIVREFGRVFVSLVGGPGGRVEAFTEVRFAHGGAELRPDGLLRVSRAGKVWQALIEVKTGKATLDPAQVESYLGLAKAKGFDAVLTISGHLMATVDERPVTIDARKHRTVALKHLSWEEIITEAALVHGHTGIDDRTRARVMDEFIRYACDPGSGMATFDDMGKHWVKVREAVKFKTIGANDAATQEVYRRFDQLARHIALQLSALTGQRVASVVPGNRPDAVSRAKQLADSGELFGTLRIPGAPGLLILNANLGTERIGCSMSTTAPRSGRPMSKINWLTKQLTDAPDSIRVSAHHAGSRTEATAALLASVRGDPAELVPPLGKDIRSFTVTHETSMGSKRAGSEGGFVSTMVKLANSFYADVVQVLRDGRA